MPHVCKITKLPCPQHPSLVSAQCALWASVGKCGQVWACYTQKGGITLQFAAKLLRVVQCSPLVEVSQLRFQWFKWHDSYEP